MKNKEGWTPLHACCHSPTTQDAALKIIEEICDTNGKLDLVTYIGQGRVRKIGHLFISPRRTEWSP